MAGGVDRAQQDAAAPSLISERPSEAPKSETTDSHQPVVPVEPPAIEAAANGVRPSGVADANAKAGPALSEQTEDQGAAPKVSQIEPEPTSGGPASVPLDTTAVTDSPVQLPAVIPDKITPQDVEKAEDASVKMLAANLVSGTSSNGDLTKDKDVVMMDALAESGPASQGALEDFPPVAGEKRKAEEPAEANGDANKKKPVLEEPAVSGEAAVGESPRGKTGGRPKGVKKAPAAVGKTARRTRSQGAADL